MNFANNLSELGSEFSIQASKWECSPANTLIEARWHPEAEMQVACVLGTNPQESEKIGGVGAEPSRFKICFSNSFI